MSKPWARLRKHGPSAIFDWHEDEKSARAAIDASALKYGEQIYRIQTVAYFPDEDDKTSPNDYNKSVLK